MADLYPNPEINWHRERAVGHALERVALDAVRDRIGEVSEEVTLLSGGLANDSFRIGNDKVLRIYRRDPESLSREYALLGRSWGRFRVPAILERGEDFLLLEFIPHRSLESRAEHGRATGLALAEIHEQSFDVCGMFGASICIESPWEDFTAAIEDYVRAAAVECEDTLFDQVVEFVGDQKPRLREAIQTPVLLHGDFKPSNLHWTDDDRLLVLDWEFAYAGPAWMDIGQLVRFGCPEPFRSSFEESYVAAGGVLLPDWESCARIFDLVNLVGLARKAPTGSTRNEVCRRRIASTLEES